MAERNETITESDSGVMADRSPAPLPWLLDAAPDGALLVTDAHGRLVYAGPDQDEVLARIRDLAREAA